MKEILRKGLKQHQTVIDLISHDQELLDTVTAVGDLLVERFSAGRKVWFCGNGGSSSDAAHLAAEFSGRYYLDRRALPAEALHVNAAFLTAVANDYGYQTVYARALEAHGNKHDVLVLLSTSGVSENILKAQQKAKKMGITTIAITGQKITELTKAVDFRLQIPSEITPRIQEATMLIGHIICEYVEEQLFGE